MSDQALKEQQRINRQLVILTWVTKLTIKYPKLGGLVITLLYRGK